MGIRDNSGIGYNVNSNLATNISLLWEFELFDNMAEMEIERWFSYMYIEKAYEGTLSTTQALDVILKTIKEFLGEATKSYTSEGEFIAQYTTNTDKPFYIHIRESEVIVFNKPKSFNIYGTSFSGNSVKDEIIEALIKTGIYTPNPKSDEGRVYMRYAFPSAEGVRFHYRDFKASPLDIIRKNYTVEVQEQVDVLLDRVGEAESGLIILNGPPGTGKTHLIRSILSEVRGKRSGMICVPPMTFLSNLSLLVQAISSESSSMVVFEDLGDVITTSSSAEHVDIFSNLLNVTDGLLSLLNDSIIILSFNTDLDKINPAVLRPGRCLGQIEIKELPVEQIARLLEDEGLDLPLTKQSYTLAEFYEMKRTGTLLSKNVAKKSTMGFGR